MAHKRIDPLVQPQDIMSTILERCNIRIPDTVQEKSLFGTLSEGQRVIRKVAISTGALHKELLSVETRILVTDGEWSLLFGYQETQALRKVVVIGVDAATRGYLTKFSRAGLTEISSFLKTSVSYSEN